MKNRFLLLCLAMLCSTALWAEKLDRVEPPCWWIGMNTDLQLMLYGDRIADAKVTADASAKGLSVGKVTSTENVPEDYYYDLATKAERLRLLTEMEAEMERELE